MPTIIEDKVMHALELASEASERAGKWATPSEVTAFGNTGEVGLNCIVNTSDLNALVQEGRAESTTTKTGFISEGTITTKQMLYRPQHGGGPTDSKAKKAEPRKPPRKPEQPDGKPFFSEKGPREPLTTEELLGDVPGGSAAPGAPIGGVGGAVGRQIL